MTETRNSYGGAVSLSINKHFFVNDRNSEFVWWGYKSFNKQTSLCKWQKLRIHMKSKPRGDWQLSETKPQTHRRLKYEHFRIKVRTKLAQWLESRISSPKTVGSIPWRSRVRNSFSVPPSQILCRLVCVWPPLPPTLSARHASTCVLTLKIPFPSGVKE